MSDALRTKCCPKCQAPLPGDAPQGLCPKCLLAAASIPTETGQPASEHPAPPVLETVAAAFPQLEILELIGQGGMGFVFKARQPKLDRFVALKILPQSLGADPAFAERFSREGRVLAKLNHPNIVTIHDFGQANGFFYLLMEFVDGVNLRQAMKVGRFTPTQALAIVPKICEALQFAHNEGILHRDIKPENILLDLKGRVKIADFGIAKIVGTNAPLTPSLSASNGERVAKPGEGESPSLTDAGKVLGTPRYMAPEQLDNPQDVDQRADIYSLGVVFYEMLTGDLPTGHFALPSEISAADPRVDEVVLRALEKERERRQRSADEVKSQVETIVATPAGSSRREEAPSVKSAIRNPQSAMEPSSLQTPIKRARWIGISAGVFALGALLVVVLLFLVLLLDGVIFGLLWLASWVVASQVQDGARTVTPNGIILLLATLLCALPINWLIVRRFWRMVKSSFSDDESRMPPAPLLTGRLVWVGGLALAAAIVGVIAAAFISSGIGSSDPTILADQPFKLRSLPNATVIQAGLAKPDSPWAWQELEKRAQAGHVDHAEANQILDGFAAWMRREHPQGYNQPLFWIGRLIDELAKHPLLGETNALAFLDAYYGHPSIEPLPRIRESDSSLHLACNWRSSWLNRNSFGFELLNEMRSISVDGRQVPVGNVSIRNWDDDSYRGSLELPKLAPGKHVLRCEVESAFVAASEMSGLARDATSKDWPPAEGRWVRTCEAEFMVYAADAEIVGLTEDPAFNPVAGGALSCRQILIRRNSGRLVATVAFDIARQQKQPISVDVTLRLAGQTIACGKLFSVSTVTGRPVRSAANDSNLTAEIEPLDAQLKEAEILLTPNPRWVEEYPYVDRIWGKEIVISNVPLSRQDLYGARTSN